MIAASGKKRITFVTAMKFFDPTVGFTNHGAAVRIAVMLLGCAVIAFSFLSCSTENPETTSGSVGDISILPAPLKLTRQSGAFTITDKTRIIIHDDNPDAAGVAGFLADFIREATGIHVPVEETAASSNGKGVILLEAIPDDGRFGKEGYELTVGEDGIAISAPYPAGLFYGVQTLRQLLPESKKAGVNEHRGSAARIPCLDVIDRPRYSWRGMHLDVSRHFFPKEVILNYLDLMAFHKMNTFHCHLVDGAGWRIEIERYPRLTEYGAWRTDTTGEPWSFTTIRAPGPDDKSKPYGGYYTQSDIREIVEYARERFITVVPEIELPGHSNAALASYPQYLCANAEETNLEYRNSGVFCAGKDETFDFIQNILDEVIGLFPGPYIHIGGDEVPKRYWRACPDCQARIKHEGLADENGLQSYFIRRIETFLSSRGKKLIGWDEILEGGLAHEATVMSWRGMEGGIKAAEQRHDVIMTPEESCYFNHYQGSPDLEPKAWGGFTPLSEVYAFEPTPPELQPDKALHILGAQGCVWTEFIETPDMIDYMVLPRMSALAEVLWSAPENRNWEDFKQRMIRQYRRYDAMQLAYAKSAFNVRFAVTTAPPEYNAVVTMDSDAGGVDVRYTLDGTDPTSHSPMYNEPITVSKTAVITAGTFADGVLAGKVASTEYNRHKAIGKKPVLLNTYSTGYPGIGDFTLTNGLRGSKNYGDGQWQGYVGVDLDAVIDLGKETTISKISSTYFHNPGVWIFMPSAVIYSVSTDGAVFETVANSENTMPQTTAGPKIREFSRSFDPVSARYVKVTAKSIGVCPEWHAGAGRAAWLFCDEIVVE